MTMADAFRTGEDRASGRARTTARAVAAVLAVLFVIQALRRVIAPDGFVVQLSDDAFYYFAVAEHLANGEGFTIDGLHAAGGVQLLWPLVLTPLAFVFGAQALPLLTTLLGLVLLLLAGYLAVRLLERYVPFDLAFALGLLLVSRPNVIDLATNGQESALVLVALFGWALAALSRPVRTGPRPILPELLWTLALPFVRTELLVLPLGRVLFGLFASLRGLERGTWPRPLACGLASFAAWVLAQLVFFDQLVPPSGFAVPWALQDAFWQTEPSAASVLERYWFFGRPLLLGEPFAAAGIALGATAAWIVLAPLARVRRWVPLLVVLLLAFFGIDDLGVPLLGALLLFVAPASPGQLWRSPVLPGFAAGWIAFGIVLVLHLLLRQYPRDHYFIIVALPGIMGLAHLLGVLRRGEGLLLLVPEERRKQLVWLLIALFAVLDLGHRSRRYPGQLENEFVGRIAPALLGVDAAHAPPLAGFHSGVLSWAYPGPVMNLDGVVDGAVLPHARAHAIVAWLRELGVPFVVDSPRQLENEDRDRMFPHASGRLLGPEGYLELVPLATFDVPGVRGSRARLTDVQLLVRVPGVAAGERLARELGQGPRLLGEYRGQRVAVLPTELLDGPTIYYETGTTQRILTLDPSRQLAPYVVFPLPVPHGRLQQGRTVLLEW